MLLSQPWILSPRTPRLNQIHSASTYRKLMPLPCQCWWVDSSSFVSNLTICNGGNWIGHYQRTRHKFDSVVHVAISDDSKPSSSFKRTIKLYKTFGIKNGSRIRLNARLHEIEPDLNEDPRDRWATPGVDAEDFKYGEWDGHHTFYEGEDKRTFWETLKEEYTSTEPPTGFQGLISWIFLPAVAAGMYFNVPGEYLFGGAILFMFIFCVIEMDKPDKPHNFEPQIYNMERGARDKLIEDYNTMSIWDFNEKYGDLWDFTIPRDEIIKRISSKQL